MIPQIQCYAVAAIAMTGKAAPVLDELPIDDNNQVPIDDNAKEPVD